MGGIRIRPPTARIRTLPPSEPGVARSVVAPAVAVSSRTPAPSTVELAEKAIKFAEAISEKRYYPYQVEPARRIIQAVIDNEGVEITCLMSRQVGKSTMIASICASLMVLMPEFAKTWEQDQRFNRRDDHGRYRGYKDGFWIGVFAPVKQLADLLYNKVRDVFSTDAAQSVLQELGLSFTVANGNQVTLSNKSVVKSLSASEHSKIEGHTFHLAVQEECQDINTLKIAKSISPMVSAYHGSTLSIGTSNATKCYFYHATQRNKRHAMTTGIVNHFEYDYKVCQQHNSLYKLYIEKEKFRLGEDSDSFRMSYALEWLLERGMFITKERLEAVGVTATNHKIFGYPVSHSFLWEDSSPDPRAHYVVGVDFGKRHDSTVATVIKVDWDHPVVKRWVNTEADMVEYAAYRKHIVAWLEIFGDDYESQFYQLCEFIRKFHIEKIILDATGLGAVMSDKFVTEFEGVTVVPFVFSLQSKSEGFKAISNDFNAKRLTYPAGEGTMASRVWRNFTDQMLMLEKEYREQHMLCHAPEDEENSHDDYCSSALLAAWGANEPAFGGVEVLHDNPFLHNKTERVAGRLVE